MPAPIAASGPLTGIRVLDFSRVLAGPHCARMLADMGADVIKVEPPDGDVTRYGQPRVPGMALYFVQQNCGKRNISLDLNHPEAAPLLLALAPQVDVVLENFRPGVMDKLGLGWERWRTANERIVYGAISGYGQDGPWRERRAYARMVHAETGIMHTDAVSKGRDAEHDTYSHADVYAALECLAAINAALVQRARTGRGQRIDVAMAETMLTVNEHAATDLSGVPLDGPTLGRGNNPVFATAAGEQVTMAADPANDAAFPIWCKAIDRPDLVDDPRFATGADRIARRTELLAEFQAWVTQAGSVTDIEAAFARVRVPIGEVRSIVEFAATDWVRDRGALVEVDDRAGGTITIPNSPWRFSDATTGVSGVPAFRGEHNRDVFGSLLGLDDAELDRLAADGVLSSHTPSGPSREAQ